MPSTKQQQRRRKAKKPGTHASAKQKEMKLNGNQYVHKCLLMELQMAAHQQQLQEAEAQLLTAGTREQVRLCSGVVPSRGHCALMTKALYHMLRLHLPRPESHAHAA
jgi:hypothetical protein